MTEEEIRQIMQSYVLKNYVGMSAREFITKLESVIVARYRVPIEFSRIFVPCDINFEFVIKRAAVLDLHNDMHMDNIISRCLSETSDVDNKNQLLSVSFFPRYSTEEKAVIYEVHITMGILNKGKDIATGMYVGPPKDCIFRTDEVISIVDRVLKLGHPIFDTDFNPIELKYSSPLKSAAK